MLGRLSKEHWPIFLLGSFSSLANLYLPIYLARVLEPSEMGLYKVFFLYMGAIPFLFLTGGPLHSVYYWAGREKSQRSRYLQQSFALAFGLSFLILILGLPLRGLIAQTIKLNSNHVALMLLGAFLTVPADFYTQTKIALGSPFKGSFYDAAFEIAKVSALVFIAWSTKNVEAIFLAFCAVFGVKLVLSIALKAKDGILKSDFGLEKAREIFRYCLPISLAGLASFFVDKMDQILLAARLSQEDFAFYSMGCLMIPPLYMLENAVVSVLVPKLAKAWTEENHEGLKHFRKAAGHNAFLMIPSFFGLALFADPIIEILYTEKFSQAAEYFKIFAFTYLILIIPHDAVPRATGKTKWIFKMALATGAASLLGVVFAASYWHPAAALGTAMFFKFASRAAGLAYSASIMRWKIRHCLPWKDIAGYFLVSVSLAGLCLISEDMFSSETTWFLFCAPVFAAIYLAVFSGYWSFHAKGGPL